jgi:hypothetical protein
MKLHLFILSLICITIFGCQKEESETIGTRDTSLNKNSALTNRLGKASQATTSNDNVLDGTSAYSVKLPVTITLNGQVIVVTSESQFTAIQANKDASASDDDIVKFTFPITIILRNYQEVVINNQDDLDDIEEDEDDISEVDCVTIIYPITINLYNTNNQIASSLTIQNDSQLINFIKNITSTTIYELKYPVQVKDANNVTLNITSNEQFIDVIDDSILDCGLNAGNVTGFEDILKSGQWKITFFNDDDDDETAQYVGYVFTFNADKTISIINGAQNSSGTWNFFLDSGVYKLDLTFADSNLGELIEDWMLLEFNNSKIDLKVSDDDDDVNYLEFSKI